MATTSHAQAVKSLNKSPGRKRFIFKTFSQRVEEIDIDVYRSLHKVKSEPSEGSSFFRDRLIEWRELNTAEDFICLHEELFPLAPTLPLVLLHQKTIFSKLVSRLNMKARLSLEPILQLLEALSRDLLEDFLPFLQDLVGALVNLLESGADREPDIIEQIFSSWSHIIMNLQKYLTRNIPYVLRVTVNLRYYPKEYIQEFIAEAMSFLLRSRNTSVEQFIRAIMVEVVEEPTEVRKTGVSALLSNAMKGTSSRLHSRAEQILQSLTGKSLFRIGDKSSQGSDAIVEVISGAFERICEDLEAKELSLIFSYLYKEISESIAENSMVHANRLLTVLVSSVGVDKGRKVSDYSPLLDLVNLLVKTLPLSHGSEDWMSNVLDNVFSLMIRILEWLHSCSNLSAVTSCSIKWAPVFQLQHLSLLKFIGDLLHKDITILDAFRDNIIRALDKLMGSSNGEAIHLLSSFCKKMEVEVHGFNLYGGMSEVGILGISSSMSEIIKHWIGLLSNLQQKNLDESSPIEKTSLAMLWGVIRCYPYVFDDQQNLALLMTLVDALDQLLMTEGNLGFSRHTWQSMIGAALSSYCKANTSKGLVLEDVRKVIQIVTRYKSSQHVLVAVADYLDSVFGSGLEKMTPSDIKNMVFEKGIYYFAANLSNPDKLVRLSTLRILCHFEPIHDGKDTDEVLAHLKTIEEIPLSVSTSGKLILEISKIQMDVSAGRINEAYALWLLYGMIGIFQNRFSSPWGPATECVAVLISKNTSSLWDRFIQYFEECQLSFLASQTQPPNADTNMSDEPSDLVKQFDLFVDPPREITPCESVLLLLIQSMQKIPDVSEAKSRQLIPLFLKFLGYKDDDISSVGSFNASLCKGKKWKGILKEWLNLLILMRNARSFYRSQFLKDVLQHRLLDENDADIQTKVLDCLLMWKDNFLVPYEVKLKNLICTRTLREELTTWSLSKESTLIEEGHRPYLVPLVIRILAPKVRKLKKLASRKHASVYHRKAVLSFIAEVDVNELPLFFTLLIKPLQIISAETEWNWYWSSETISKDEFLRLDLLQYFSVENMAALSMKKIYGFLHVVEDVLATFDEFHIKAFLNLLMGFVARVLGGCTSVLEKSADSSSDNNSCSVVDDVEAANHALINTSQGHVKDVRSLCLRILSTVLNKYEDHDFGSQFWDMFFFSIKPLIDNFKQGGSSSEKPSSLFFCFLSMSRSPRLVSLLFREENLVPDIFSILSSGKVSEAVVSGVLKFVENLLVLDSELGEEENNVRGVLLVNLNTLICSLHSLFLGNSLTKRKLLKSPSESQFRIFKLLPKYLEDPVLARRFMDILLPFITNGSQNADLCQEVLQVVKDIVPLLGADCSTEILNAVSPLLTSVELERRISICNLLMTLTTVDPSLLVVGSLLNQLNAFSAMEGGLDYDTVINSYESITAEFFGFLTEDHALLILSQFVYDISSDDLILRHSAYRSLLAFVDFCEGIVLLDVNDAGDAMVVDGWTRLSVQRCIVKFLLKHMGVSVREGKSIRKEWIDLLRAMVMKLPGVGGLDTLKPLCSEDAEVDFFNNLVHLQKHRRARALTRFRNVIGTANFSEVIMKKVFVPMFFNTLFDVQEGKNEQIKNSCIEAIAAISAHMDWNSYYALLTRCFREISLDSDKQKVVLRMICAILDRFHFSAANPDIQQCLEKNLLPKVQKLVNADSDKVNVSINLAALKLLKLLPGEKMDTHLPTIVHRVSNFLKSRMESVRDEARSALAACLKELGLDYLQFILKAMKATLKRGYEMHVLGYTLNYLLSKALANNPNGIKLDYCLDDLLSVVENDILGEVAEQKDVEKIASKMRETRKRMSYETLRLIAQNVTFRSHGLKLLSPVAAHLKDHLTPKVKTKLEGMLSHIAMGIESNPSVDQTDLFVFIYGLVEDGIDKENGANRPVSGTDPDLPKKPAESNKRGKKTVERRVITKELLSSHMITGFALTLLHNRLKNMKLNKGDEELLSKLDPFIKLLCNCLGSKYEDVLSTSLRCLTPLVRLPLPSLEPQADKIKTALLDIAQNSISSSSPLTDSCLRLLTALLRNSKITLSDEQLHVLIMFPMFVDLERNPSFVALSLLKAIVHRTLIVHEIFDLMTKVGELMVKSQLESVRKKCSQILLPFLLDYNLSDKRLQQHLDSLLANLRYEHSSGREAVLEMLHAVIVKFPKKSLNAQSKAIFFDLVLCLSNDNENKVRLMTGAVIKLLFKHIDGGRLKSILDDSLSWYLGEKKQLRGAAAQVLGLFVEVKKKEFQEHIAVVLPMVKSTVQAAVTAAANTEQDLPEGPALPYWKEAYYSLVLFEKVLHQFPHLSFVKELEDIWEAICELLLHPHTWLWTISNRLISFYFATMPEKCTKDNTVIEPTHFLMKPSRLFFISASLCCQLKTQISDESSATLIAGNLMFAMCGLHKSAKKMGPSAWKDEWNKPGGEEEQIRFMRGFELLDPRNGKAIFLDLVSGVVENSQMNGEDVRYLPVRYLVKRMGKIAVLVEPVSMKIVFDTFQKLASKIGGEGSMIYADELLLPVYKVSEGYSGTLVSDDLKQVAQEVAENMRKTIGIDNFVRVYSRIRKGMEGRRDMRKREINTTLADPARNAKRKLRIAAKNRGNKKRKVMSMKMQRWMR